MERYHHQADKYRRGRRAQRLKRLLIVLLILVVTALVVGTVFIVLNIKAEKPTVQQSPRQDLGYYSGNPRKVVSNEVFSFESTKDWQFARGDSQVPTKYVFYSSKNNIVQYELKIFTGRTPPDTSVNFIMPVTVVNNKMTPQRISPQCVFPPNVKADYVPQKYGEVKFNCSNSPSRSIVAIGVVGDSYDVPLYTAKGSVKIVGMQFVDHTTNPYEQVLSDIVSSFKFN